MAAKDWAGVTAGLALATFGLGAFVASSPEPAPAPAVEQAAVTEAPATVEVVLGPLDVEIPGLSDAAARTLAARGYADLAPAQDLGLPQAVQRVLEREGTVLLVPEGDGS
jgi:hypothetical protein